MAKGIGIPKKTGLILSTVIILATLVIPGSLAMPTMAKAGTKSSSELEQNLAEMKIINGQNVLESGHIDLGPTFDDGKWAFLIHDDLAKADANAESVWRYPQQSVFRVLDEAKQIVPDDPAYSFLGAKANTEVFVVPQTQKNDVLWLGWNTQDPQVKSTINRGMTLTLKGVQGPGALSVYLQSGTFTAPQILWDSKVNESQSFWVDVNTHTHANWVFTQAGIYLVELQARADLLDGSTVSDTQVLRFAVGSATSTSEALAAQWVERGNSEKNNSGENTSTASVNTLPEKNSNTLSSVLIILIVAISVALGGSIIFVLVRSALTKKRVFGSPRNTQSNTKKSQEQP